VSPFIKAARGEDLQIEKPVGWRDAPAFDFHPTVAGMLSPTLIRHKVIQVRESSEKRLLTAVWMVKRFPHAPLPLAGMMGLIQPGAGHQPLRVGANGLPARLLLLHPAPRGADDCGQGSDYVMIVKDNQPQLRADIELVFALPPVGDRQETARTLDIGHGRIEQRNITTSEALVGYSNWPGLAQVFKLGRHVITPKTTEERVEVVYGITSLSPERGMPERLLALVRGHWQIENKLHWVRDVTCDEDRSQVRCGNIPQVMAALRNTTIGLLRWAGYSNMAAACRRFAAQPDLALTLLGIKLEN